MYIKNSAIKLFDKESAINLVNSIRNGTNKIVSFELSEEPCACITKRKERKSHVNLDMEDSEIFENNRTLMKGILGKGKLHKYDFGIMLETISNDKKLDIYDREMHRILIWHLNFKNNKGLCCPSSGTIAKISGVSIRKVNISLNNLRENYWIDWKIKSKGHSFYRCFLVRTPESRDEYIKKIKNSL